MLDVEINIESKIYRLSVPIRPVIDPCAWAGWYLFRFSSHTSLKLHVNTSIEYREYRVSTTKTITQKISLYLLCLMHNCT